MLNILVTCPPMIKQINNYVDLFKKHNLNVVCPKFKQTLSENELINIVPNYDGWIIGDDEVTFKILNIGKKGKLRALVKWGVGVDNIDFDACKKLELPITNIPNAFGEEVSDVAIGYLLCLTRQLHNIDNATKNGNWVKPCGESLSNKKCCLVGFGDIGRCVARKLLAFNLNVYVSDPGFTQNKESHKIDCKYNLNISLNSNLEKVFIKSLDECVKNCDYIIITCSLNKSTYGLINKKLMLLANKGVKIINVSRGPVINENDLIELLKSGHIDSVGLDVFCEEPVNKNSELLGFKKCIFGSHNGSNTIEAVNNTSIKAIDYMVGFL
jgi:D-3-phosphoglycerate dehydrogenase